MSFYITLSDSQKNFNGNLKAQFAKAFRLRGEWEVGVAMCIVESKANAMVWVFCDVADYSYINDVPMQIVDVLDPNVTKNFKPMYVKIIKKSFTSINVQLKQKPFVNELFSENNGDVTCILHFCKA